MVALGGSVALGHGPVHLKATFLRRFFDWIGATFPNTDHRFINHALPAASFLSNIPSALNLVRSVLHPHPGLLSRSRHRTSARARQNWYLPMLTSSSLNSR